MIENTLLYFKTKTAFNTQLEADNIKNDSIAFIQDAKQIWTHGTYFDCSTFDPSDIESSIQNITDNYTTKSEVAERINSTLFIGTEDQYNTAKSEGKIRLGALVIILEQDELDTAIITSLLGTAVLGKMVLGVY